MRRVVATRIAQPTGHPFTSSPPPMWLLRLECGHVARQFVTFWPLVPRSLAERQPPPRHATCPTCN